MAKKEKWFRSGIFKWLLAIVITGTLAFSGWQIYNILVPNIKDAMTASYVASIADERDNDFGVLDYFIGRPDGSYQTAEQLAAAERRIIDWSALRALNPEIIAWIYIPNTTVDYAVVQTNNNNFYLRHNILRQRSAAGAIFMEVSHSYDFNQPDSILYGHHMRNSRKFGLLERYKDRAFREGHRYIFVYTPELTRRFAYSDQALSSVVQIDTVERDEKVLTLVTCDYTPGATHLVIRADLVMLFPPGRPCSARTPISAEE